MAHNSLKKKTASPQWKNVGRSVSTKLQKLGTTTGKNAIPKEFIESKEKMRDMKHVLEELIKMLRKYNKSQAAISAASTGFAVPLEDFGTFLAQDHVMSPALSKFQQALKEIDALRLVFKDEIESKLIQPTEQFILEGIDPARETKKSWRRARGESDAALAKVANHIKRIDVDTPSKLLVAHINYIHARTKEEQRFEVAADNIGDVLWMRDFKVMSNITDTLSALHDYFLQAYDQLYQLDLYMQHLTEHANDKRIEYHRMKNERKEAQLLKKEEEKKKQISTSCRTIDYQGIGNYEQYGSSMYFQSGFYYGGPCQRLGCFWLDLACD